MSSENRFTKGLTDGLPIALGYLAVSFAFGIQAAAVGMPVLAATAMSLTNLTSAGQFAGLTLLSTGGRLLETALTQLVINLRYSLMSATLSQRVDSTLTTPHRLLVSFFVTDEIFAVASSQPAGIGRRYLYGLGALPIVGWTLGTFLGAAAGTILPLSVRTALGIALFGMFIAIIIPPAKKSKPVALVIVISIALRCLLRYAPGLREISGGFAVILCAIIAAVVGAVFFPVGGDADGA